MEILDDEKEKKLILLAENVLNLSRTSLTVNLRFMDSALNRLKHEVYSGLMGTDGGRVLFNPVFVLKSYKQEKTLVTHQYLHMVLHCVFQHFYVDYGVEHFYWDLACDIAVEATISDLELESVEVSGDSARKAEIDRYKKRAKYLTAECLYRYFLDHNIDMNELLILKSLFEFDDHEIWYKRENEETQNESANNDENNNDSKEKKESSILQHNEFLDNENDNTNDGKGRNNLEQLKKEWKNVAESMQTALETFEQQRGTDAGNLIQNLTAVNREKYDYSAFLKRFAVMSESMKINDDEFDYIFYTYGLSLYERMPLIEPLEYKDTKKIKDFVIAIDTSGSVSGELVQKFVQKTYNILLQEESFNRKFNLHIIQCDAEIQEDKVIKSKKDFDEYIDNMTLKGFGGTDFRPVFNYIEHLINDKQFTNLKGMIYFTDGFGVFPEHQPPYQTAFVFVDDDYTDVKVPVWAIKLILRTEEI